jgi:RNA polymerase sigma factor (sigma-70 family)
MNNLCHPFGFCGDISDVMITNKTVTTAEYSDAELVSRSLAGDREAFSRIVSRYQILICSLAYCRIGHLGLSEDVAQETFITAWKHLRLLREPDKLRSWLCGIVRNRINKSLQREGREPVRAAEPLETADNSPAREALPSEQAIGREEEAILWRALEQIPELYREPLILFYREHQSIEQVAAELELSEDAVKQRLSRGRKLLQEEVQAFVENTLRRTAPRQAFSAAVLAALPSAPAAVGVGLAGKGTAMAKAGFGGIWLGPLIGILGGLVAHWLIVRISPTARERRIKKFALIGFWIFVLAWCVPGQMALRALAKHFGWNTQTFCYATAGFWWVYAAVIITIGTVMFRQVLAIRRQAEEAAGTPPAPRTNRAPFKMSTRVILFAGVYLCCFSWLINLAWQAHDYVATGIITIVMVVLGLWNFLQTRGKTGAAVMEIVAKHQVLVWTTLLLIVNWRVETWAAAGRGISLVEMHRLLPPWIVPLLTLMLVAWFGILLAATRRVQNR